MKRQREVVVEIDQVLVYRKLENSGRGWCDPCAAEVVLIAPDLAAALSRQSTRTIYRWVEQGRLHYRDEPIGSGLVCLNSLQTSRDNHTATDNEQSTETRKA